MPSTCFERTWQDYGRQEYEHVHTHSEVIRTSHKFDIALEGGLELSREVNALAGGSFALLFDFTAGIVTGALGASGRGFCWKLKVEGCGSKVVKRDMALCKGAEAIET